MPSLIRLLPLLLSLSAFAVAKVDVALPGTANTVLTPRQANTPTVNLTNQPPPLGPLPPRCLDYALTANLSTIGANNTYRSAYLQLSPLGSIPNQRLLSAAQAKLPAMTVDQALNRECGNWTTIAFVGAEANFTEGIVGPFNNLASIGPNHQSIIRAGPELIAIVGVVLLLLNGVWLFMP